MMNATLDAPLGIARARAALAVGFCADAVVAARKARRGRSGAALPVLALAEAEALLGLLRHREALNVATRGLKRGPLERDVAARLRLVRAHALWLTGRLSAGRVEAERAATEAEAPLTRARAREIQGLLSWKGQAFNEARAHLREAWGLFSECGDSEGLTRTLEKEAGILRDLGLFEQALRAQTRRIEIASTTTRLDAVAQARSERGDLLAFLGRWDEARADLLAAEDLFRRLSDPREFALAGAVRAMMVDLARGDLAAVRSVLDRLREAGDFGSPRMLAEHRVLAADLHLAAGEAAPGADAAAEAVSLFGLVRCPAGESRARIRRALALLELGRVDEAQREARRAARLAPESRSDLRALACLVLGRVCLRGRRPVAARAFDQAERQARGRPGLAAAARLGRALARGRGREDQEVREALQGLETWGDRRLVAYALADLRLLCGEGEVVNAPETRPPATETAPEPCRHVRALAAASEPLIDGKDWPEAWAACGRALAGVLELERAAWVTEEGWLWRRGGAAAEPLREGDPARALADRAAGAKGPLIVDLARDPATCDNTLRIVEALGLALIVPARPGAFLYVDFREGRTPPDGRAVALLGELARLLARRALPALQRLEPARFPGIVGRCAPMESLFEQMTRVAPSSLPVHLFGETGTGKERVARALHDRSPRREGPFVAVNASSLSDELFEAEMFGHTRGAFTGAVGERRGHVAEADGGTLFIDEVADLTPRAQAKLLRFLNDGEYRRLGESEARRADARIVTAANARLAERVATGRFREDLLYRLGMTLELPPLRERGDDIPLLARHFLKQIARRENLAVPAFPADVAEALRRRPWPGNVRELEHEVHRLLVLAGGGPLRVEHLSVAPLKAAALDARPLREARAVFERQLVAQTLERHDGNRSRAASFLGISRQALVVKIRQLGL